MVSLYFVSYSSVFLVVSSSGAGFTPRADSGGGVGSPGIPEGKSSARVITAPCIHVDLARGRDSKRVVIASAAAADASFLCTRFCFLAEREVKGEEKEGFGCWGFGRVEVNGEEKIMGG